MKNIILIGFMGTGKSTVGQALANQLSAELVDLDQAIASHVGKDIPTIFREYGENYFRDTETALLRDILNKHGHVVTTGGGAVLRAENVALMKSTGFVVALHATVDEIVARVSSDQGRPLLQGDVQERVITLLEQRRGMYDFADVHVDTTGEPVEKIVEKIMAAMVERGTYRTE